MHKKVKKIIATDNLKVQIDKYIRPRTTDITVYEGEEVFLLPTNIRVINPIKIVIRKAGKVYVILHYGQYSKDQNDIYLYTPNNKISWLKLIDILQKGGK